MNVVRGKNACRSAAIFSLMLFGYPLPAQEPARSTTLKLVVLEGEGAINNIRLRRAKEPVVRVVDENSAPVKGASVTFLLPDMGPAGEFAGGVRSLAVIADEKGEAAGRGLMPNKIPGSFKIRVVASYRGQSVSGVVNQTNAEPGGAEHGFPKKLLVIGAIAGAAAAGVAFAAGGHGGGSPATPTPAAGPTSQPGIVIVSGSPSFQPPH